MFNGNIEAINQHTKKIDGWLTKKEGEFLFRTAQQCTNSGAIVEIGSWKGKSTIWLGLGSKMGKNELIYAIDPFGENDSIIKENFGIFKNNIEGAKVDDVIIPFIDFSENVVKKWNKPIGFIFIDGNHEYEAVKQDFLSWFPHLIEGGIIAFHDTTSSIQNLLFGFPGPKKVVNEYVFNTKLFKNVGRADTIVYGTKSSIITTDDIKRTKQVKLKKYFPDLLHLMFWNLKKIPYPSKLKYIIKKLCRL